MHFHIVTRNLKKIRMHERIQKSKKTIWMFIYWQNILQERILWRNMKELIQMKNLIYVCNAFLGHLEICKVLLANQVTKIFMKNNGLTPLHMAWGTGKYEVCKILVKAWKKEEFTNLIFVILTSHKKAKKHNWKKCLVPLRFESDALKFFSFKIIRSHTGEKHYGCSF